MLHVNRGKKRLQACVPYILFYTVLFHPVGYVCLSTMQFLLRSFHHHTNHKRQCVCGLVSQCNVLQAHIQSHHTGTVPLLLCFPIVPVFKAEQIDIHWSIAKQSKICPPQKVACRRKKCCTSLHETKMSNLQVESLGVMLRKRPHSCAAPK